MVKNSALSLKHCIVIAWNIQMPFNNDDTFNLTNRNKIKKIINCWHGGIGQEISKLSNSFGLKVYSVTKDKIK